MSSPNLRTFLTFANSDCEKHVHWCLNVGQVVSLIGKVALNPWHLEFWPWLCARNTVSSQEEWLQATKYLNRPCTNRVSVRINQPNMQTHEGMHWSLSGHLVVFRIACCSIRGFQKILTELSAFLGSAKDGVGFPFGFHFNDISVSHKYENRKLFWEGTYLTGRICLLLSQSSATIQLNVVWNNMALLPLSPAELLRRGGD